MATAWSIRWPAAATRTSTCWISASGQQTRLTDAPSIETAPSYSPDGSKIVFESDRSGTQQTLRDAGRRGRAGADLVRGRAAMARRSGRRAATDRLHQAEPGPLLHRRDAHRRIGRAAADRVAARRGPDLVAQRPGDHVHPPIARAKVAGRRSIPWTSRAGTCARCPPIPSPRTRPGRRFFRDACISTPGNKVLVSTPIGPRTRNGRKHMTTEYQGDPAARRAGPGGLHQSRPLRQGAAPTGRTARWAPASTSPACGKRPDQPGLFPADHRRQGAFRRRSAHADARSAADPGRAGAVAQQQSDLQVALIEGHADEQGTPPTTSRWATGGPIR